MKLGFFTDLHFRGENPSGRSDDYRKSLLKKLEEMGQIWKDNNVECILFGGDLCHTPDPATSVKYDLMREFKNWNLPICAVIGSHDYYGYQIKSISRTTVGLFEKSGVLQIIGSDGFLPFFNIEEVFDGGIHHKTRIIGTPHNWWLCDDPKNFFCNKEDDIDFQIQLVHGDLLDVPVPWSHTLCKDAITQSDLVLSGHYHPGWEKPLQINNTVYINPGSIGRVENGKERLPRVCIINTEDRNVNFCSLNSCEYHPFVVKSDNFVEDFNHQDINKLLSTLENTTIEIVDIKEKIPLVIKELQFDSTIINKCFEIIEIANKG